jgi:hypothetical protein
MIRYYGDVMRKMELDGVIQRWKKTNRALRIHDQEFGRQLTDVLERVTDEQLVHFRDPVEAAAFFCLLDLVKKVSGGKPGVGGMEAVLPRRQTVLTAGRAP